MEHEVDFRKFEYKIGDHCIDDSRGEYSPRVDIAALNECDEDEEKRCILSLDAVKLIKKILEEARRLDDEGR